MIDVFGFPVPVDGFNRETVLRSEGSERFNAIGPGLDLEMDAGQYGPIGVAVFMGARLYKVLGDRTISMRAEASFDDVFGNDVSVANYEVKVNPLFFRAHVGIRFLFIGNKP